MDFFRIIAVGFVCMAMSACTITMKEDMIFNPPSHNAAADVATMALEDEGKLLDAESDLSDSLAGLLPAKVTHGYLETPDQPTAYTLIEAAGEAGDDRPLIVSCYGSGGDRPHHGVYYAEKLLPWGDVLEFDYPGYGDTTGTPSIAGIESQRPFVIEKAEAIAGDRPLIYWGHSLGGWVCPHFAASSAKADAMVYETSALNSKEASVVWKPWYMRMLPIRMEPEKSLEGDNNAAPLKDFDGPVLVVSGGKDKILPAWLSKSLYEALKAQGNDVTYIEVEDGTHINAPLQPQFQQHAAAFFARVRDGD